MAIIKLTLIEITFLSKKNIFLDSFLCNFMRPKTCDKDFSREKKNYITRRCNWPECNSSTNQNVEPYYNQIKLVGLSYEMTVTGSYNPSIFLLLMLVLLFLDEKIKGKPMFLRIYAFIVLISK